MVIVAVVVVAEIAVVEYKYWLLVISTSPVSFNFILKAVHKILLIHPFDNLHARSVFWFGSASLLVFSVIFTFISLILAIIVATAVAVVICAIYFLVS